MGKVEVAVILSVNIENTINKKDLPDKPFVSKEMGINRYSLFTQLITFQNL
jgi:hypothetical protein